MKPGEGSGLELGTKGSANAGHGTDGEGVARVGARSQTGLGEDLVTEGGVFGVQNQPSEAGLSKLKYISKQAGEVVPVS